jgi:RNA polymerase sporulation-specific sigma factor
MPALEPSKVFKEHSEWPEMAAGYWFKKLTKEWGIDFFDYDDLLQIASVGMFKAIKTYSSEKGTKLRTWVHTHINNEVLTEVRKYNKSIKTIALIITNNDDEEYSFDVPFEELGFESVENNIIIDNIKKILTEREFKVLWMYTVDGMSQTQIAPVIGVQQPQVYRILNNIRRKVKSGEKCQI